MNSRNGRYAFAALTLGALAAFPATAVRADDMAAEIRLLKARLRQLEAKVAAQDRKQKQLQTNVRNAAAPAAQVCKDGPCPPALPPVFVSFKNGLFVETLDHAFSFKIGGRLLVDGGGSSQPELGKSGNAGIRRARLEVEGKAFAYWLYKLQYDFAGNNIATTLGGATTSPIGGMRDAYLALKDYPGLDLLPIPGASPVFLQVGNMFEPMGLETITSSKYIDFIERSLPNDTFTPSRHIGFATGAYGPDWSVKGGIFTTSPEDKALSPAAGIPAPFGVPKAVATGGGQYFDLAGRATYAPIKTEDTLLHLGGAVRYHRPNDSTAGNDDRVLALGSNTKSEGNILNENLVGTPDLSCGIVPSFPGSAAFVAGKCVKDVVTLGAELAAAYGPVAVQGEYFHAHYNRDPNALAFANAVGGFAPGGASLDFDGYYANATWYLTGESRAEAYKVSGLNGGEFEQIKIKHPFSAGGWGAWEIGARFSAVNLNSSPITGTTFANLVALNPFFALAGIVGGRQEDLTVGLNWYPDKGIRFMANWVRVMRLSAPFDRPFFDGAHPNIFVMRAQVDW